MVEGIKARFLAESTLNGQGEIPRYARNDSEGLGMTAMSSSVFEFLSWDG